ncbi:hypothetical protein DCAR_0623440 [Daucus carota subsp. sativus]|uniref:Uncharacterized protein n=1 Tax=Daucus carota subsp. sativus TaxID=79200 RepID=A0A175YCS4_DAUCS|nr:hypothetical protein DCAR_0623440 [Daucus carota subsp. sativus]
MKENVVDEIYNLVIASSDFVTEIEAANEEFISMFKNMEKRQSNLITQVVGINEKYGSVVDLVAKRKKPIIGGISTAFQSLLVSYSINTDRFLDDTESSLEKHSAKTKKAVDNMINNFNETVKVWGEKSDN